MPSSGMPAPSDRVAALKASRACGCSLSRRLAMVVGQKQTKGNDYGLHNEKIQPQANTGKPPVKKFQDGLLNVAIWEREDRQGQLLQHHVRTPLQEQGRGMGRHPVARRGRPPHHGSLIRPPTRRSSISAAHSQQADYPRGRLHRRPFTTT